MEHKFKFNLFKIFLLFISILLLSNVVLADTNDIFPCCIPDEFDADPTSSLLNIPVDGVCSEGRLVELCYSGTQLEPVYEPLFDTTNTAISFGCCCVGERLNPMEYSNDNNVSSYVGCYNEDSTNDFFPQTNFATASCGDDDCGFVPDDVSEITFNVKAVFTFDDETTADIDHLVGAKIIIDNAAQQEFEITSENSVSDYMFNGDYTYSVIFNKGTYYDGTDYENISCTEIAGQQLSIPTDTNKEATLQCKEADELCIPNWETLLEEDCTYYGGSMWKTYLVWDSNNCGYDDGNKPETRVQCEDEYSSDTCMQQSGDDFQIDFGEYCDRDMSSLVLYFLNDTQADPVTSLSCMDLNYNVLEGTNGMIGCTDYCTYDLANCTSPCDDDGICSGGLECGCSDCFEESVCERDCTDELPSFLAGGKDFNFTFEFQDGTLDYPIENIFKYYNYTEVQSVYNSLLPGIKFEVGSNDISLNWAYEDACQNKLYHFIITMCEKDDVGCDLSDAFTDTVSPNTFEYVIPDELEKGETYCVDICAQLKSGEKVCAYENQYFPDVNTEAYPYGVCFKVPEDEYCLITTEDDNCKEENEEFFVAGCELYSSTNQDMAGATNLFVEEKDFCEEGFCRETKDGAECIETPTCSLCNGLFGLYALQNLRVEFPTGITSNCMDSQYNFLTNNFQPNYGMCYLNETLSVVPQFDSCAAIDSCYDYNSEAACMNDPCFELIENNTNPCVWETYNNELGIGVCRTNITEEQDCSRCDENSPIGYCNENMCDAYGECYFRDVEFNRDHNIPGSIFNYLFEEDIYSDSNEREFSTCIAKRDMGCVLYETKTDCVNSSGYQNAELNFATNVLTKSNDSLGLGTCVWDEEFEYCYKNADGVIEELADESFETKEKEDCHFLRGGELVKSCVLDNEPPVTTINWENRIYGANTIPYIEMSISDNVWGSGNAELADFSLPANFINTYISFNTTEGCINDCNYMLIQSISQDIFGNSYEGIMDVSYYSKDKAKNMEEIKTESVHIDAKSPHITLLSKKEFVETHQGIHFTDIELEFETNESANCSMSLRVPGDDTISFYGKGDIGKQELLVGDTLISAYEGLKDGRYVLNVSCHDQYFNYFKEPFIIDVEGDKTIYDAKPRSGTYNTLVNKKLELKTLYPSVCKYHIFDGDIVNFEDMEGTFVSEPFDKAINSVSGLDWDEDIQVNNTLHTKYLTDIFHGRNPVENRSYTVYVGCNKTEEAGVVAGEITQNDVMDSMSFTFDTNPPVTRIYLRNSTGGYSEFLPEEDTTYYDDERILKLVLDDYDVNMYEPFGSGTIYRCILDELPGTNSGTRFSKDGGEAEEDSEIPDVEDPDSEIPDIHPDDEIDCDFVPAAGPEKIFSLSYPECHDCYIAYYSEDDGGNVEDKIHIVHSKIRNVDFEDPSIIVDDITYT